jgi:CRP/FNR family transcriptional regulator, anaerobic regulatory protein
VAPSLPTATRNRARTSKRSIPPREPSGSREVTRGAMLSVMQLNSRIRLRGELALGRQELNAKFDSSPPRILRSGELLAVAVGSRDAIYHLRAGWACQFRDLPNGRRAIVDIYLPGDVIGLDAAIRTRRSEEVLTLTSVTVETIHAEDALIDLTATQSTALYIVWLLSQRQRRADRLRAALSCLDARGRLATMLLDLYTRLRRRKLITASEYNLPLTQIQIGSYLGLTTVHVNRTVRLLRDERIVQMEKHCVAILDLERLRNLAQDGAITNAGERALSEAAD